MSENISNIDANESSKSAFANLTESNLSVITELEQKLKKETGENVVLVAYCI